MQEEAIASWIEAMEDKKREIKEQQVKLDDMMKEIESINHQFYLIISIPSDSSDLPSTFQF